MKERFSEVAGKRSEGIHTFMVCEFCGAYVRASRHSREDCDTIYTLKHGGFEEKGSMNGRPDVPCPTCGKPGEFDKMVGTAVEKVVWENYPPPYDVLKQGDQIGMTGGEETK